VTLLQVYELALKLTDLGGDSPITKWRRHLLKALVQTAGPLATFLD
jgi:hypothetical protein